MGIISFSFPYKTHISYIFCRQPIYSPYRGSNYSYLLKFSNIMISSYTSDFFTYIEPYMGSFMSVVCVFLIRMSVEYAYFRFACVLVVTLFLIQCTGFSESSWTQENDKNKQIEIFFSKYYIINNV